MLKVIISISNFNIWILFVAKITLSNVSHSLPTYEAILLNKFHYSLNNLLFQPNQTHFQRNPLIISEIAALIDFTSLFF